MNRPDSRQSLWHFVRSVSLSPVFSFDTLVIAFGFGIGLYFSLSSEPYLGALGLASLALGGLLWWGKDQDGRFKSSLWVWGMLALALLCGVMRATWHTEAVSSPRLPTYERSYDVSGWVERIDASGKGVRWHVRVKDIEGLLLYAPLCPPRPNLLCQAGITLRSALFLKALADLALLFLYPRSRQCLIKLVSSGD